MYIYKTLLKNIYLKREERLLRLRTFVNLKKPADNFLS